MAKNAFAEVIETRNEAYDVPKEGAPAIERQPLTPLTGQEIFEAQFDHIAAIVSDEERVTAIHRGIADAQSDQKSALELKLADVNLARLADSTARVPDKARAERNNLKHAALIAQKPVIEMEAKRQWDMTPGTMLPVLMKFFDSQARFEKFERRNTPTDIREGESVMAANARLIARWKELAMVDKKTTIRAQTPADDRERMAREAVRVAGKRAKLDQFVGALRNVSFDERSGFKHRTPSAPEGNAFDIMAALFPEQVVAALTAKAMEGYDARAVLDDVTRMERLNEIESEMEALEYTAEANHRHARAIGENPGPRLSSNPLALLDLKRVEK